MNGHDVMELGLDQGEAVGLALALAEKAERAGASQAQIRAHLQAVIDGPEGRIEDVWFAELAQHLVAAAQEPVWEERQEPAPWKQWGADLDPNAVDQLRNACRLPVAVRGALMPDAHRGYGLPIGGVLACEGAVIPYAVGVDIACRMRLTVYDVADTALQSSHERLIEILEEETSFGIGARFDGRQIRDHEVMDRDWGRTQLTRRLKDRARVQLGSSGSGNHFVEWGALEIAEEEQMGLKPGRYLALLSHSGSRGAGATIAGHYSRLAQELHPELPRELQHLAWLDLDSEAGQEYWWAMNLMGDYAAANHAVIHREVSRALGAEIAAEVENHHNFAWKEEHEGREVIVHRKGATPAGAGVLGVIPGSMASPCYVVRGRGDASSLESASHGAGRVMSRTAAKKALAWSDLEATLTERGVTLLSAGLDEAPDVYKDIDEVMSYQDDLVEIVARFDPKIVKMAPAGEPAED